MMANFRCLNLNADVMLKINYLIVGWEMFQIQHTFCSLNKSHHTCLGLCKAQTYCATEITWAPFVINCFRNVNSILYPATLDLWKFVIFFSWIGHSYISLKTKPPKCCCPWCFNDLGSNLGLKELLSLICHPILFFTCTCSCLTAVQHRKRSHL